MQQNRFLLVKKFKSIESAQLWINLLTIVCFEDLWVNEVCVYFLWKLDFKTKNKT